MSRKRSNKFDDHNIKAIESIRKLIIPDLCKDIRWRTAQTEYGDPAYIFMYTLDNRDVVCMKFVCDSNTSKVRRCEFRWWVSLYIGPRCNVDIDVDGTQTGRCGMHGLVIAKQMIMLFILQKLEPGQTIFVGGADGRRFRIYRHYLGALGFKETTYDRKPAMMFTRPISSKFPTLEHDIMEQVGKWYA